MKTFKIIYPLTILLAFSLKTFSQDKSPYLFSTEIKTKLEKDSVAWKNQTAAWNYSFIAEYSEALNCWDYGRKPRKDSLSASEKTFFSKYHPISAIDYIAEKAKSEKIIIINEAHHIPLHRVFTTLLLEKLYAQGYGLIGLEALDSRDTLLNERKYPVHASGFYTNEPQFGNLIRAALKTGFTIFSYEADPGKNGKEREIEQALNIKKVLEKNPGKKIIVYCGFDHIREDSVKNWDKAMAGRLKEYTGIDPLTINQVALTEKSSRGYESPLYRLMNAKKAAVFIDSEQKVFNNPENSRQFDVAIFHPVSKLINGRPDWLLLNGKRQPVAISYVHLLKFPVQVYAFHVGEDPQMAIPADLIELKNEKDNKSLILDPGNYLIKLKSISGSEESYTITVNPQKI